MLNVRILLRVLVAVSLVFVTRPATAIINGGRVPAEKEDAFAAVIFRGAQGACSATAVGPRVLLTAAFCIGATDRPGYVGIGPRQYAIERCVLHPDYGSRREADFALCFTRADLPLSDFPRVDTAPGTLSLGLTVQITGFGCQAAGGYDSSYGIFGVGRATISSLPDEGGAGQAQLTGDALCFGDGGGGVFLAGDAGPKRLVGVNSQSDLQERSYISLTSSRSFVQWARGLSIRHESPICGVSEGAEGCKAVAGSAILDVITPEPDTFSDVMTQVGTYKIPDDGIVEGSVLKVSANPEETLRELVDRVCGPEPERYFEALSESTGIPDPSFDEPMVGGEEIAIPLCSLDTVWYETTLVRSGDTLWSIFKSQPDVLLGGLPRWQFFEVPPGSVEGDAVNSGVFVEAFKALNPGKNPTALAIGDRILVPLAPASGTVHLAQKLAPQFGITPQLSLTDFELQSEDADCVRPASYENYPYSVQGLLDALQVNRIVMDEGRAKRIQTRVIIADSGLYQVGKSIFSWAVVPYPRDGNERKFANRVQPVYWPDEKMSHGTQVASLVLGGPTFGRFQALMKSSPVMVVPVRIYDVKESEFINPQTNERKSGLQRIVQQNAFDTVLKAAKDLDARIVNLSIKTASTIPEMEQDGFGEQSDILFVVAAGNGDGKIGRETTVTYPAVYGDHLNVLAVAALDGEGDVPVFSNWNSEFVHIAAPGCSVPVLSFEPATTRFFEGRWHGTSLSAPLVSFAAALVDSEAGGNLRPWQIKERLVVASDLDEKRADRVLDGRALDIPKASAIWVDAVETTKAPGLIFGAATIIKSGAPLKMESVLRFDCGEAGDLAIRVHQLRKLTPRFRNVNGKTFGKIYYQKVATGRLEGAACMVPDNLSVQFNDLLGGSSLTLSMTEIADIVPRMLPRYEPDQPN